MDWMTHHAWLNIPSVSVQVQKIRIKQVTLDVTWVDAMTFGCKCYLSQWVFRLTSIDSRNKNIVGVHLR